MREGPPYDAIAEEFSRARTHLLPKEAVCLEALLKRLPAGARVLDLGCGSGTPVAVSVAAHGHAITGVDASPRLLEKARATLPGHMWLEGNLATVEVAGSFEAVICWYALFHSPRAEWPGMIRRVHAWLKPGGYFLLSSGGEVSAEGFTDTMFGHSFYYDSLTPEELCTVLEATGFEIVLTEWCNLPDGARDRGRVGTLARRIS